jgi:response regulator NasT
MKAGSFKSLKIAIAEDEADLRQALAALLRALGHEVTCAVGNGAELLEQCSQCDVDLVLVDLDMPVVDGLEAAEQFAARQIPVILLSGHPDAERVNLEEEPIAARLRKPATLDGLKAAISQAVIEPG